MSSSCLLLAATASVGQVPMLAVGLPEDMGALVGRAFGLVGEAYLRAPTLVLALSALLVLPAVALISVATQATRRYRSRRAALRAARLRIDAVVAAGDIPDTVGLPVRSQAWLTVEGMGGTMALAGQVVRIGRHHDNDIRLADRSVHRHHAVIERTPDEAFVITDIGGRHGTGMRVNGRRMERVQLADGDVIELGRARLRFENETAAPMWGQELDATSGRPAEIEG